MIQVDSGIVKVRQNRFIPSEDAGSSVRQKTPDLRCQERVAVESIGLDADTLGTSLH
jgi:hypothetical protein